MTIKLKVKVLSVICKAIIVLTNGTGQLISVLVLLPLAS